MAVSRQEDSPFFDMLGRAPEPGIESTILAVRVGAIPLEAALPAMADWPFIALNHDPGGFAPLVVDSARGPRIALFTSPDRAGGFAGGSTTPLRVPARLIAQGAKGGAGLVVNPGSEPLLDIDEKALATMGSTPRRFEPRPPGSAELTTLEQTMARCWSGFSTSADVYAALADAEILLASQPDPTDGRPRFTTLDAGDLTTIVAWTSRAFMKGVPESATLVISRGREVRTLLGEVTVYLDPRSGIQTVIPGPDLP